MLISTLTDLIAAVKFCFFIDSLMMAYWKLKHVAGFIQLRENIFKE